jgi:hypothetical protein
MKLSVTNVKKTEGAGTPPARPKGLFIDPDTSNSSDDASPQVIDVPARQVEESGDDSDFNIRVSPADTAPAPKNADNGKSSLRARFGGKREPGLGLDSASDAEGTTETPQKSSKKPKVEKQPKAPKAPKVKTAKTRSSGKALTQLTILAELDTGRSLYWTLEAGRLIQLADAPATPAFSFSKEDFRFKAEGGLSHKQASDVALQEVGESVQVINRTRDLGAVYATRQERALASKQSLTPAQQVLDILMGKKYAEGASVICGFLLKDADSDLSLAVLYHIGPDGEATKPQISVNPDSMEFVIAQFSASRKLDKSTTQVVLFDNAEFLSVAGEAQAYPNERVWRGMPVRKLLWGAAVASMAVAVGCSAWAAFEFQQVVSLKSQQAALKTSIATIQQDVGVKVKESLPNFVDTMSLDIRQLATRGQSMWVPGSRMVLTADLANAKYEMWLMVSTGKTFFNRPSTLEPITVETHQKLINFVAPDGCVRDALGVAGSMNETELTINCETGNPALARYRND